MKSPRMSYGKPAKTQEKSSEFEDGRNNSGFPPQSFEYPQQWQQKQDELNFEPRINRFVADPKEKESDDLYNNFNNIRRDVWGGRSIPEDRIVDHDDDDEALNDEIESLAMSHKRISMDRPIGIQSFSNAIARSHSSSSSSKSSGRPWSKPSSRNGNRFLTKERSHQSHKVRIIDDEDEVGSVGTKHSTSSGSYSKPLGLPNNAIVASMLFRRHHNIDTEEVDAKIKAREQEYQVDRSRGDIPQSINANADMYSCVSSFSEDTAAQLDAWRKPTRDLLDHFAQSRRTNFDFKKHLKEQRANATALFEA